MKPEINERCMMKNSNGNPDGNGFRHAGFTLVELVFMIIMFCIVAILVVSMFIPATAGKLIEVDVRQTANRGAQLAKSLYARNLDRSQVGWPETYAIERADEVGINWSSSDLYFLDIIGGWDRDTSNEYFNTISPLGDVDFTFAGAEGSKGATPLPGSVTNKNIRSRFIERNPKTGRGGNHNAWCMTLNLNSSASSNIPFMFTKNLRFNDDRLDQLVPYDITKPNDPTSGPLNENVDILEGKKALTVGIQGNVTTFYNEKQITAEAFNSSICTNRFIWPAGSKEPEGHLKPET